MSFANPAGLAALGAVFLVILLALLRVRERRREVAEIALWRDLRSVPAARIQRARALVDPLLLLQVACAAALALAVAQPAWRAQTERGQHIAVLLDASASMQAVSTDSATLFAQAVQVAVQQLDRLPAPNVSVVLVSSRPSVLVGPEPYGSSTRAVLHSSAPSWNGDADGDDILSALAALGGAEAFDRILWFGDRPPVSLPFAIEAVVLPREANLAITQFAVRERASGGVSAFVEVANETVEFQSLAVVVSDGSTRANVETLLEPGERGAVTAFFPSSRGSRFTASLAADDGFVADNVRYAAIDRSPPLSVRWIGEDNRFLRSALEAAAPLEFTDAAEADLTVVYDAALAQLPPRPALLVRAQLPGLVTESNASVSGFAASDVSHPLLEGVRPEEIYVEHLDRAEVALPHRVLLRVGDNPLLIEVADPEARHYVLLSDLTATNLPITVEFPILIRNLIELAVQRATPAPGDEALVGRILPLPASGDATAWGPAGDVDVLRIGDNELAILPEKPGFYGIAGPDGERVVAVNLDSCESTLSAPDMISEEPAGFAGAVTQPHWRSLGPGLAGAALALLLIESYVESSRRRRGGRGL
ncbi:MAG: BatA domain-containing protein [Candidatus Bipolaricaulota bacterium]